MSLRAGIAVLIAAVAIAGVVIFAIDGDDEEAEANATDGALIAGMIPHHEAAIEMAEIALERADHAEVRRLARAIVEAQSSEIEELEAIHERLFDEPVAAADHGSLGLGPRAMGMHMDVSMLHDTRHFDRAFIDMMVPHHQGAIRMARIHLARGEDSELKGISEAIIDAQSGEIKEMNSWRTDWYGKRSPAGGVPHGRATGARPHDEAMGHG